VRCGPEHASFRPDLRQDVSLSLAGNVGGPMSARRKSRNPVHAYLATWVVPVAIVLAIWPVFMFHGGDRWAGEIIWILILCLVVAAVRFAISRSARGREKQERLRDARLGR
jgi:hypothetical protein